MPINVKDAQFGATGTGQTDDTGAIQAAINFAKLQTTSGGAYRPVVYFPAGFYRIESPLNITNTSGIWLQGDGGRYLNSVIIGNTNGLMLDFSGSNEVGCEDLMFIRSTTQGYSAIRPSTIGILFSRTSVGGLRNGIRNCHFELYDLPAANNGFGTIGILNVRSEEFFIHECIIKANTCIIMSSQIILNETGVTFTVSSSYQSLLTGTGSMGVTSIIATSLIGFEKRRQALILFNTNSFTFQGYIGREIASASPGSNEVAIQCVRYNTNININSTIESYSGILTSTLAGFDGNTLNIVHANSVVPTYPLIDLTGCSVKGLNARITLPNLSERSRFFIYHAPIANGTQLATGFMQNCELTCFDIDENKYMISSNLLKRSENVVLNSNQPFEKKGGKIKQLFSNQVSLGVSNSVTSSVIVRFREANQPTEVALNNTNAGFYRIWIDGVVKGGSYGSGVQFVMTFQAQLVVSQDYTGSSTSYAPTSTTVIILDKSVTNPSQLDIASLSVDLTFSAGVGTVTLTPRILGQLSISGVEPISYNGYVELLSDFLVNEAIILK